jgi:hypothetical protein
MDFKFERDFGAGKRRISMGLKNTELERVPAALQQALLEAEKADNPAALLQAWAALLDPMLGALQLSLLDGPGGEGDGDDR